MSAPRSRFTPQRDPWTAAVPPPGVLPEGRTALAFDDCLPTTQAWAAESLISAGWAEGLYFPGYAYLAELSQRAEYRRPSERLATEMTRKWIELQTVGDEDGDKPAILNELKQKKRSEKIHAIEAELKRLKVREAFREAALQDGLFGRSHLYVDMGADEAEKATSIGDGSNATSKNKLKNQKIKALRPVEAMWAYPSQYNATDPLRSDWYRPSSWYVMGQEVHATRLLTFVGREMPDILKPAYGFGGISLSQLGKPYVDNWLRTRQAVSDLVQSFSVWILKTNLFATLQAGGEQMGARVDYFNAMRSNRGAALVDKSSEDLSNVATPLGTLDALQAQSQEHMASVWGIPLVIFLGIQPAGLNASSDGEIRVFYDWTESQQENLFRPHLQTIVNMIQLSLFGEIDEGIGFRFVPLWSTSETEAATVRKTDADTDAVLIDAGVISQEESRKRIAEDADSPYHGLDASEVPELPDEEATGQPFGERNKVAEPDNDNPEKMVAR